MKKAFTMLEFVFVIVIIGILAAVVIPRTGSNRLHEAAVQVVSHIRYTQHLAIVDDKFDVNKKDSSTGEPKWFKERWQIMFSNADNGAWSYVVFSDSLGDSTGNPDPAEVAVNPLNGAKKLTGGNSGTGIIHYNDENATNELNIGVKYGIEDVIFSSTCSISTSRRIAFDYLGRPLRGAFQNYTSAYPAANRLITSTCIITLINSEGNVSIAIEPETGYAHIL